MLVAGIILLVILLILLLAYLCYRACFYAKPKGEKLNPLPNNPQFIPVKERIDQLVTEGQSYGFQPIAIRNQEGLRLRGRYYAFGEKKGPLILFFHGYRSTALQDGIGALSLCHKEKIDLLLVDQRAHGLSQGRTITFGVKERLDCLCWVEEMDRRWQGKRPLVLYGLSLGAATVLAASGEKLPKSVKAVIADCGFSTPKDIILKVCQDRKLPGPLLYPLLKLGALLYGGFNPDSCSAIGQIAQCQLPLLLIHGEEDHYVPLAMSQDMYGAASHLGDKVELFTVPEAGHGLSYLLATETYEQKVLDFLRRYADLPEKTE